MSPEHFQGPAGGVMTQTFERELQKRIEQANPPNEQWHGRWPRTLLCDRYVEVIRAATRNIQSICSWTPLKSRPSAIGEAACDTRFSEATVCRRKISDFPLTIVHSYYLYYRPWHNTIRLLALSPPSLTVHISCPWPTFGRCGEFSSAVEGGCLACDIVIHYACMTDLERTELRDGEFVCDVCSAFRMDNDAMFRFWKDKVCESPHHIGLRFLL